MADHQSRIGPAVAALAITPNNDADIPSASACIGLYIGAGGNLVFDDAAGNPIAATAVVAGHFNVQVRRVRATGTTATGILALYSEPVQAP